MCLSRTSPYLLVTDHTAKFTLLNCGLRKIQWPVLWVRFSEFGSVILTHQLIDLATKKWHYFGNSYSSEHYKLFKKHSREEQVTGMSNRLLLLCTLHSLHLLCGFMPLSKAIPCSQ